MLKSIAPLLFSILGFMVMRLPGALIGYFIGRMFQGTRVYTSRGPFNGPFQSVYQPDNDFQLNLLALASIIIKADGAVEEVELRTVRNAFKQMYGEERAQQIFRQYKTDFDQKNTSLEEICRRIAMRSPMETREQIFLFLRRVAEADGSISDSEFQKLSQIARFFNIGQQKVQDTYKQSSAAAYNILGVPKDATDTEVKNAYRKLVKRYHPDKVITKDEALKIGAEEKFKEIQEAYEIIQKERSSN